MRADKQNILHLRPRRLRRAVLAVALAAVYSSCSMMAMAQISPSGENVNDTTSVIGGGPVLPFSHMPAPAPQVTPVRRGDVDYALNAEVGGVRVEVAQDGIPADGQTPVRITVHLFDKQGAPLTGMVFVTLENSGGRILLPGAATDELRPGALDADRVTPGTQLKIENGVADFLLLAPSVPQEVVLRVTAGAHEASGVITYIPEVREMLAVGLIEGVINLRKLSASQVTPARSGDGFEQEIRNFERQFNQGKHNAAARTAFFIKGRIKGEYLLTAAFDSDKQTRDRLLRDIRPDEFYPVLGDGSLRGFEARSTQKLYVRIDKNKNYLLYGDFATGSGFTQLTGGGKTADLQMRNLGNYNRTVTGLRHHFEENGVTANVYVARDRLKQVVEEFPGRGLSGPYPVSNNAGIQNSEKVEIIIRDRNQPTVILSATPLTRFADYTFEPFSGRVLLSQPIPSVDQNMNPVSLRISYEVDQGGEDFWLGGIDGQVRLGSRVELGGSAVEDRNPLAPYKLRSANIGINIAENTTLVGEIASTSSTVNTGTGVNSFSPPTLTAQTGDINGNAARIELRHEGDTLQARAFFGRSDPTFNNPAATLNGGRSEALLSATGQVSERAKLYVEAVRSESKILGGESKGGRTGLLMQLTEKLALDVGLRHIEETAPRAGNALTVPVPITAPLGSGLDGSLSNGAGGGFYTTTSNAINPLTGLPQINTGNAFLANTVAAGLQPLDATTMRIGLNYRASDRIDLMGEVEHDIQGDDHRRYALGSHYRVAERTKLYARYENQTGLASLYSLNPDAKSSALVMGVDTSYMKDGQLFSEYRLRDAVAGRDMQLASGIRNFWDIAEGTRFSTSLERLKVFQGPGQEAVAATTGLDYTASPLWKGSTRLEFRRSFSNALTPGFDTWLSTLAVARKLSRDWTLLGRNYLLYADKKASGDIFQDRFQVGVAYRDTDRNLVNALGRYELRTERDNSQTAPLNRRAHIVSTHADYHPSRPWWLSGRLASKWVNENLAGTPASYSAQLISGRVTYDITEKWDVGLLSSILYSPQGASYQRAYGIEAGYLLAQNLWMSAGHNWSGFSDRDLAGSDYTNRGFYLRLRFKFDEDLFARKDEQINRALERPKVQEQKNEH